VHIVFYVRSDNQGGYHLTQQIDEHASGTGLTTGATYIGSQNETTSWYARPPFPQIYTQTYSLVLASSGAAPNFLFLADVHTTVTPAGVPTASVDHFRQRCAG